MLDTIDFSKMRTLGAGGNNVCFTDKKIAVKFGNVDQDEVDLMVEAAKHELSVPVLYYAQNVQLPHAAMELINNFPERFYYEGGTVPYPVYTIRKKSRANVLIMPYAKPLMRNDKQYTDAYQEKMYAVAEEFSERYLEVMGYEWMDNHPWNLGYYRDNLVILDV